MTNYDYITLQSMQISVAQMIEDAKKMYNNNKDIELLDLLLKLQLTDIALDTIFYKQSSTDRRNKNGDI